MRGQLADDNTTRVSKNGYHYTKTPDKGWQLTHHLIAEETLGRPINKGRERVVFGPGGKTDLSPENIKVVPAGKGSTRRRIAAIEARIDELQAEKLELERELLR
jgi:hypothetical protein